MTEEILRIIIIAAICLAGIALLYFLLFKGPAIVIYKKTFARKTGIPPIGITEKDPILGSYAARIQECAEYITSCPSKEITITASDGTRLCGTHYGRGSKALAICFHGFTGHPLTNFSVFGKDLLDMGFDLLIVDHRAHFRSGGDYSTVGILESDDVCCWVDWADRNMTCDRILLCGVSMGCAAIEMASDKITSPKVHAMILESGMRSPYEQMGLDMKKRHFPTSLVLPLVRLKAKKELGIELKQSSCDALAKTDIPAFFLHGSRDDVVPLYIGNARYEACKSTKEMLIVEGAGHTAAYIAGYDDAKPLVGSFITRYFGAI